ALLRDRGRYLPPIDVMHRLVALDRFNPAVRKRHECARGDQGFYCLFVAIERITEFPQDTGADVLDRHGTPLKAPLLRPEELRPPGSRETRFWPLCQPIHRAWRGIGDPTSRGWPIPFGVLARGARIQFYGLIAGEIASTNQAARIHLRPPVAENVIIAVWSTSS